MEREELDQIPWSQLAIEADDGVDRRWYIVGIAVGLVVVAVLAFRLLSGGSGQPDPSAARGPLGDASVGTPVEDTAATIPAEAVQADDATSVEVPADPMAGDRAITEAQLTVGDTTPDAEEVVVAEWFITDLFTIDGSPETAAAVRARVSPELLDDPLAHDDPDAVETFVEWARAFRIEDAPTGPMISVAFRTIRRTDAGYVREPVRAVVVPLVSVDEQWLVTAWPTTVDPP